MKHYSFMTQKHPYTAPETELLVVRFEENIMSFDANNNTEIFDVDDTIFIF